MSKFYRAGAFAFAAISVSPAFAAEAPSPESAQAAVALVSDGVVPKGESDPACPKVVFAPNGGVFPSKDDDHAATVEALARDCANLGAETILKVAVVGEGTRDSAKGASSFNAPLRVAVKDGEGHEVETRRIRLKVQMPEGVQKVSFNHLEENVSLPPAPEGGYRDWTVTVGFDPAAPAAAPSPKPAKPVRAAAVKRASRVARAPAPVPPIPMAAPMPVSRQGDMRTLFQRLAAEKTARTIEARDAQLAAQQRQLEEKAKAQRQARPSQPVSGEAKANTPAKPSPQAALVPQPQVRTAYNVR